MKKIKQIQELQAEQERLHQEQQELADKITAQYRDLLIALNPLNAARKIFSDLFKKKTNQK